MNSSSGRIPRGPRRSKISVVLKSDVGSVGTNATEENVRNGVVNAEDNSFCWRKFLAANPNHDFEPVPVFSFQFAPLNKIWDQLEIPNLNVEYRSGEKVENESAIYENVYWVGVIREYFGYMVKVEPLGCTKANLNAPYRWVNYLTDCFKIGHCSSMEDSCVIPPTDIRTLEVDWRLQIMEAVTDQLTIYKNVPDMLEEERREFPAGTKLEVLDNNCISRMKLGFVTKSKGTRVFVRYWDGLGPPNSPGSGLWCDIASGLAQPPGWSQTVGHEISAPEDYHPNNLPEDLVLMGKENPDIDIQVGMMLEAVDPINPSVIAAATVVKVLKYGYIMVSFVNEDSDSEETKVLNGDGTTATQNNEQNEQSDEQTSLKNSGNDSFCYHVTSRMIFYSGFCEQWGIKLSPPKQFAGQAFKWQEYFDATGTSALPLKSARQYDSKHSFKKGRKLEAADLVDSSLVCVATVATAKGRLLKINFDGWSNEFDQWMDVESADLYPVGWCDYHEIKLTGPDKSSPFWKAYHHHTAQKHNFKRRVSLKRPSPPELIPISVKRTPKRKAIEDLEEDAVYNNENVKAEAIKVGERPRLLKRSSLDELRTSGILKSTVPSIAANTETPEA